MTAKTTEEPKKSASSNDPFQEEFNALPLDKKFARLFQMEVATLNETFSYVAKSSREAFEKVSEAFVDFGEKVECEAKKATSPSDPKPSADAPKAASPKAKTAGKRKPAAPRKPKI